MPKPEQQAFFRKWALRVRLPYAFPLSSSAHPYQSPTLPLLSARLSLSRATLFITLLLHVHTRPSSILLQSGAADCSSPRVNVLHPLFKRRGNFAFQDHILSCNIYKIDEFRDVILKVGGQIVHTKCYPKANTLFNYISATM